MIRATFARCGHKGLQASLIIFGALSFTSVASAQVLGSHYASDYTTSTIGPAPGVFGLQGGMTFKAGDPSRLLLVGDTTSLTALIYQVSVTRDALGHIDGFSGSASVLASAPRADGGLRYGPGGVLLFTTWPNNSLGQIKPGSSAPDRFVDLTSLGVAISTGGIDITPAGFAGAGKLHITSFDNSNSYSADLVPDGSGTFDVTNVMFGTDLWGGPVPPGPESVIHVDATAPAFAVQSVLICEWNLSSVASFDLDANGNPVTAQRREFLTSFSCSGSAVDPLTGDFLFVEYNTGQIVVVQTADGPIGTRYCSPAVPNSTGQPGVITASGALAAASNNVTLTASSLPQNAFGFFLTSETQGMVTNPGGSQGDLCLGGSIGRFVGAGQILNSGASGAFALAVDLGAIPTPTGFVPVLPGETWNFQAWHRDANPLVTSNFTDAVSVTFL